VIGNPWRAINPLSACVLQPAHCIISPALKTLVPGRVRPGAVIISSMSGGGGPAAADLGKGWGELTTAGPVKARRLRQRAQLILDLLTPRGQSPIPL
jgi:hypothetical protein